MRSKVNFDSILGFMLIVLIAAALSITGYFVFEHEPAPPERTECVVIAHTDITDATRETLLDQGWVPTDSAVHSPGCLGEPPCDFIDADGISVTVAEQLVADGWFGSPSDGVERLYSPSCRGTLESTVPHVGQGGGTR